MKYTIEHFREADIMVKQLQDALYKARQARSAIARILHNNGETWRDLAISIHMSGRELRDEIKAVK